MAKEQASAGIIPRRKNNGVKILLLQYPQGHWSFPKGHIENNESLWETACRELREETGLTVEKQDEDFRHVFEYSFQVNDQLIHKTVTYFSGMVSDDPVELSHEHEDYKWLEPEDVEEQITHDNATEMFRQWKRDILETR